MGEACRCAPQDIIEYWQGVDFLSQNDIIPFERDIKRNSVRGRYDFLEIFDEAELLEYFTADDKNEKIYKSFPVQSDQVVFWVGNVNSAALFKKLRQLVGVSGPPAEENEDKDIYFSFCSFVTNIEGRVRSLHISPLLWAASHWISEKSFGTFSEEYYKYQKELKDYLVDSDYSANIVMEILWDELKSRFESILPEEDEGECRRFSLVYSCYADESRKKEDASMRERFLPMSPFFQQDLIMVADAIKNGAFGGGSEYERRIIDFVLAGTDGNEPSEGKQQRIIIDPASKSSDDRQQIRNFFKRVLDPRNAPEGKWPSGHQPVLMQQVAVNIAASEDPSEPAVFTVNGPPGSGKTTLLKELVADRVVKRAKLLAELDDPDSLFDGRLIPGLGRCYTVSESYSKINEYILIAAAASNNAAENISREFPAMGGVSENFKELCAKEGDYFGDIAGEFFGTTGSGEKNWLISAPLGKKDNLSLFAEKVLFPLARQSENTAEHREKFEEQKKAFLAQHKAAQELRGRLRTEAERGNSTDSCTAVLDDDFFEDYFSDSASGRNRAEGSDPYMTEEFDKAREALFFRACMLTKEFVLSSESLLRNFGLLYDLWKKQYGMPDDSTLDKLEKLQNIFPEIFPTLFLLVPIVSTTFASFGIFMEKIRNSGELGTLIVDEAGQADPDVVLGAMFRCRRAVIVGDPKQIPPVVDNVSAEIRRLLAAKIGVPEKYADAGASVQTFADSINPYGRYLGQGDDREWVGCPLTIHRRCDDPMFSIANELSYDSTLIKRTVGSRGLRGKRPYILPHSCWIDVPEAAEDSGYIKAYYMPCQGRVALRLLVSAFERRKEGLPDIFIISPFVSVVNGIKGLIRDSTFYEKIPRLREWLEDKRIGTVHTFQGREADEVIFMLGCSWNNVHVAENLSKNMINTAVTRAKRRIYIIGDAELWERSPYAALAKDKMPLADESSVVRKLTGPVHGRCSKCGEPLAEMVGRYGAYMACVNPECESCRCRVRADILSSGSLR